MKLKEPIFTLRMELGRWKGSKKSILESIHGTKGRIGSDSLHKFYGKAIDNCDEMIESYKAAIKKLKS